MQKIFKLIRENVGWLILLLIAAIAAFSGKLALTTFTSTTSTPEAVYDGFASAMVYTWEDINANGLVDMGEPAMPYVTVSFSRPDDVFTGLNGWAKPSDFRPGCRENCWEEETVSVKIPPGYLPTTPTSVDLTGEENKIYFGFVRAENVPLTYFPGEPEWQLAFINRGLKITALHFTEAKRLEMTIDWAGTAVDSYFPYSDKESFYGFYGFYALNSLVHDQQIEINEIELTILPARSKYLCQTNRVLGQVGIIDGLQILRNYCEFEGFGKK